MRTSLRSAFFLTALFLFLSASAFPADHYRARFTNDTPLELIAIRMDLDTTQGEVRRDRTDVHLPEDGSYSIDITGAIQPLRIAVEVVNGLFVFDDLSTLEMLPMMDFDVSLEDDDVWLIQSVPSGDDCKAKGKYIRYLTAANSVNAVDKTAIVKAKTNDEARQLVEAIVAAAGEPESMDVEAGPIWDNDHARERCPESIAEWGEEHGTDGSPRWNGQWTTTIPGEMSVCGMVRGPARLEETLFENDEDQTLSFPIEWNGRLGVGRTLPLERGSDAVAISLRLDLLDDSLEETLDALRQDGFRPWSSRIEYKSNREETEEQYEETPPEEAMKAILQHFDSARSEKTINVMQIILVDEETFKKAQAEESVENRSGVLLFCSQEVLDAIFLPDVSIILP